ncbi:MAG: hypothetical protein ACI8PD_001426 [Nitrospinales bacterium]|jgi:hypothetical protein
MSYEEMDRLDQIFYCLNYVSAVLRENIYNYLSCWQFRVRKVFWVNK